MNYFNKFIFISLIFFSTSFYTFSQDLNFNETVKYINYKLDKYTEFNDDINADEYGFICYGIVFYSSDIQLFKFNLKDIESIEYLYENLNHCIRLFCVNKDCINNIHYYSGTKTFKYFDYLTIIFSSEEEAKSVIKAFNHLKTLIIPDPFK